MTRFWWLKEVGGPGSPGFFLVTAIIGIACLYLSGRTRRIGRRILYSVAGLYCLLSIPAVGLSLAGSARPFAIKDAAAIASVQDIFVIDGDSYTARAALAAALDRSINPRTVWIVGFGELREALVAQGVKQEKLRWAYPEDWTTYGQFEQVRKYMEYYGIVHAVVIVSRLQAARAEGLVRRFGLNATVIASPVDREPAATGVRRFVPSLSGLMLSRDALYERVAAPYYRWKGWN